MTFRPEGRLLLDHASVPDAVARADGQVWLYYVSGQPGQHGIWAALVTSGGPLEVKGCVLLDGRYNPNAVDPDVVRLPDGRYRLFYYEGAFVGPRPLPGRPEPPHPIYSAVSADGLRFTVERQLLAADGVTDPSAILLPNGTWLMALSRGQRTLLAASADGLAFVPTGVTVDLGGVPELALLQDGRVRLFITGQGSIQSLVSADRGSTWSTEPGARLAGAAGQLVADPSALAMPDGSWTLYYKTLQPPTPVAGSAQGGGGGPRPQPSTGQPTPPPGALAPSAKPCGATPLTVLPVRRENIASLSPVGTLVPPDHVFPTPHMYFYVRNDASVSDIESPLYAPGDIVITSIGFRHYDRLGRVQDYTDYTLTFSVCDGLEMYFHHVRSLTFPPLAQAARERACAPQGPGGEKFCSVRVSVPVPAGAQIGTTGDAQAGVGGLDMGARDQRLATGRSAFANPVRWCSALGSQNIYDRCYTVCPLDYLPLSERDSILNLFTDYARSLVRTDEPRCGEVYRDRPGSAQGHWFAVGKFTHVMNEAPHLFLGPSAFTNNLEEFSVGTSVLSLKPGGYLFQPRSAGLVNRRFGEVTDGQVSCYESLYNNFKDAVAKTNALPNLTVLLRLTDGGRNVAIEGRPAASCGAGPWTMQSGGQAFER